ncbi:hypothetical protein OROMI_019472 [Orobanche minor]
MQFSVFGDESKTHIPKTISDSESAGLMADSICATVSDDSEMQISRFDSESETLVPETASPAIGDEADLSLSEGIFSLSSSAMVGDAESESMVPATPSMEFDDVNDADLNYLEWKEKYAVLLRKLYLKKKPDSRR